MIVALVGGVVGVQTLSYLLHAGRAGADRSAGAAPRPAGRQAAPPDWSRRAFLVRAGAIALASGVAGLLGRRLLTAASSGRPTTADGKPVTLPPRSRPRPSPPAPRSPSPGSPRSSCPNDDFYRIDTALIPPSVDAATWSLRVHGMVDHEVTLTYDDLAELPIFEQYVTIACVSNEVGGNLVGNAKWTGVQLRDVLAMAGVQPGATQLVGRSVDGLTAGMPTAWVMDPAREPMIAAEDERRAAAAGSTATRPG